MLKIEHKHGGTISQIVAIGHNSVYKRAYWFFIAKVKWKDGPYRWRKSNDEVEVSPSLLCIPDNGDRTDLDKALNALAEYLRIQGEFNANGQWVPHQKSGRVEVQL